MKEEMRKTVKTERQIKHVENKKVKDKESQCDGSK